MFVVGLFLLAALLLVLRDRPNMDYLTSTIIGVIGLLALSFLLNRWIKASLHVAFWTFRCPVGRSGALSARVPQKVPPLRPGTL